MYPTISPNIIAIKKTKANSRGLVPGFININSLNKIRRNPHPET